MPSTASPFGLRPAYHPSGVIRQEAGTILTGYATNILQFAPVRIATDGTLEIAAAGTRAIGCFLGVEYDDTASGRRVLTNHWTASTAATNIVAYYTRDPAIIYEIQSDATMAVATMGSQYDWNTATAGNTTTGLSEVTLDVGAGAANAGLRVVGVGQEPNNAWDDSFVNVFVEISEHQDVADVAQY